MANITSAQVKEAIDQLAAMTAAASITPEAVASVMEKLRKLTDAERQQVVEVASAYLTEINTKSQEWLNRLLSTGGSADKIVTNNGSNVQSELDTLGQRTKGLDSQIEPDKYHITDKDGNILATFDKDGLKVIDVAVLNEGTVTSIMDLLYAKVDKEEGKGLSTNDLTDELKNKILNSGGGSVDGIYDMYPDSFYITDSVGNVFLAITKSGSGDYELNYVGKGAGGGQSSFFSGKQIYTIGDSLCNSNIWQRKFASIKGCTFDGSSNTDHYSKGGTRTLDVSGQCGMDRLRLLLQEKPNAEVIFLQNVNDGNGRNIGSIDDLPFMLKNNVLYGTTYGSSSLARSAKPTVIANTTPAVGTMVRIPYTVVGKKLTINSPATSSGSIVITINGATYSVSVSAGDSVNTIQKAILNWEYAGLSDTASGTNAVVFTDTTGSAVSLDVSVNYGSTGVTGNITDGSTTAYLGFCFMSYDVAEWNDDSKWIEWTNVSPYSIHKGILEFAVTNFPKAFIAYVVMPHLNFDTSKVAKRADGSYDWNGTTMERWFYTAQRKCSDYMRVPCFDVEHQSGMNIYNYLTYYPDKNVHPKEIGYERWGETLARLTD